MRVKPHSSVCEYALGIPLGLAPNRQAGRISLSLYLFTELEGSVRLVSIMREQARGRSGGACPRMMLIQPNAAIIITTGLIGRSPIATVQRWVQMATTRSAYVGARSASRGDLVVSPATQHARYVHC